MPDTRKESTSRTLEHGLDVLLCFLKDNRELSLTEIAKAVNRNTTSTYRLIQTLTEKGFLARNPENRKYSPGMTLKLLGDLVDDRRDLVLTAHPHLVRLHAEFNENVTIYIYHNFKRLCLDRIESTQPIHQSVREGDELPLTRGAGGTALLAYLPSKVQTAVMRSDPGVPRETLEDIRTRGYAVSYNEKGLGSTGIGVPIFDRNGNVLASLNISGPVNRMTVDIVQRCIPAMLRASQAITAELP